MIDKIGRECITGSHGPSRGRFVEEQRESKRSGNGNGKLSAPQPLSSACGPEGGGEIAISTRKVCPATGAVRSQWKLGRTSKEK